MGKEMDPSSEKPQNNRPDLPNVNVKVTPPTSLDKMIASGGSGLEQRIQYTISQIISKTLEDTNQEIPE